MSAQASLCLLIEPKLIFLNISQVLQVHGVLRHAHLGWELTTGKWKVILQHEKRSVTGGSQGPQVAA